MALLLHPPPDPIITHETFGRWSFAPRAYKVRVDDILISGQDNASHLKNLRSVFTALDKAGQKLKRSKRKFLLPEETYMGYKINKEGTDTLPEKVAAMKGALTTKECYRVKNLSWSSELQSQSLTQFIEHYRGISQFNEEGHSLNMGC